jgi:hypothetical protein
MRGILWRLMVVGAACLAAALAGTGVARADESSGDSQLVDVSHKLADMQKKLTDREAKGQLAKTGQLSAMAACGFGDASQVFLPWADAADYALAPQGNLASADGWTLKNVELSGEDNPFTPGGGSLLFVKGDSEATTPVMCVNEDHPTMRFFLADRGGNGKAHLEVNVVYEDLDGHVHDLTVARLKVGEQWQPTIAIPIGINFLCNASVLGWTPVSFNFEVHGLQKGETFSLDGVYVDPSRSR